MAANIIADGQAGQNGGQGFDFSTAAGNGINGNNANCNWIDDDCAQTGGPGGPGVQGGEGGPGGPGAHGGVIEVEVNTFDATLILSAAGGKGGDGGKGGKGQDGGKGGRGGNGEDCELGRHGGNGGRGGNGGVGGPGGNGGNGGTIIVKAKSFLLNILTPQVNVSGGAGGRGGDPGAAGQPGAPGDDGSTTGVFSTSSDCENMGPVPSWGGPGDNPTPPSRGNGGSGNQGLAQIIQVQ